MKDTLKDIFLMIFIIIIALSVIFGSFIIKVAKNLYYYGYKNSYVTVEQEVNFAKRLDNTYNVQTVVRTISIYGSTQTIEWVDLERVTKDKIEEEKISQMQKAMTVYKQVEAVINIKE